MKRYVAFLRGINVGGNKKVSMDLLKKMMTSLGFLNVQTLFASGNLVFDADESNVKKLTNFVEEHFQKTFGFESKMMLRTLKEIDDIIGLEPFKGIKVERNVRLYVTFLREKSASKLQTPYISEAKDFEILFRTEREIFSVLTLLSARTVVAMGFIEKEFGKDVTTRNWNTVLKVAKK